jgi:uncharacterized protein (DUF433 family)
MEATHPRFPRITFDPNKCFGKACIRGMRMPVSSILSYLSSGMSQEEILRDWPELEPEDIRQALAYASEAMEERVLFLDEPVAS